MVAIGNPISDYISDYRKIVVRYGWLKYIKYYGIIFIFLITMFQCSSMFIKQHDDLHFSEKSEGEISNSKISITVTPGFIGAHISEPDLNGLCLVTSDSTVNVDAIIEDKDGNILFSVENIPPEGSFWVDTKQFSRVSVSAG